MAPPDTTQVEVPTLSTDLLIKLLPDHFDGNRYEIRSFIKGVDQAMEIATTSQKSILIPFIKKRITGKAKDQINIHCKLTTWDEISELLMSLFQDKKSFGQLLEDINAMKQNRNESVTEYFQRLEETSSRLLAVIYAEESDPQILPGRVSMITDMTLNRFVYHTQPHISQLLRYRDLKTINEALTAATTEEKVFQRNPNGNQATHHYQKCAICKKSNHQTHQCFFNKDKNLTTARMSKPIHVTQPRQFTPRYQSNQNQTQNRIVQSSNQNQNSYQNHFQQTQNSNILCRYCKETGHDISVCIKRQRANQRKLQNQAQQPPQDSHRSVHFQTPNFQTLSLDHNPPELSQNHLNEQSIQQ